MGRTNVKKDNGVQFALNNCKKCLQAVRSNDSYSYLRRVVEIEKRKIASIFKTGDLIEYFKGFSESSHKHAEAFEKLSENGRIFLPNERMAKYLLEHFPDEANNITSLDDFVIGKCYTNDFLSVVLGGSYARSLRYSRRGQIAYLVLNPFKVGSNIWSDRYQLLKYRPYGERYKKHDKLLDLCNSLHNHRILIFEKSFRGDYAFVGEYCCVGTDNLRIIFSRRVSATDDDIRVLDNLKPKSIDNIDAIHHLNIDAVIADALIGKAIENGIEFQIKKLEQNGLSYFVDFPSGFYEFFDDYKPHKLIIASYDMRPTDIQGIARDLKANSVLWTDSILGKKLSAKRIHDYGWSIIGDQLVEYKKRYYQKLIELAPEKFLSSKAGVLGQGILDDKKRTIKQYGWMVSEFLYSSLSREAEESDDGEVKKLKLDANNKGSGIIAICEYEGDYARFDLEDPVFIIVDGSINTPYDSILESLDHSLKDRAVIISLSQTGKGSKNDRRHFGISFINQLARLYPTLTAQYLLRDFYDAPNLNSDDILDGKPEENDLTNELSNANKRRLRELIVNNRNIALFLGNGVSIPFGSEGWKDLSKNLLGQLEQTYLRSFDDIYKFFGESLLAITDYAYDTLVNNGAEALYWKSIKHSIYRRYQEEMRSNKSAIFSIATAKANRWDQVSLFTYNYDTFLENVFNFNNTKQLESVSTPSTTSYENSWVVHLHGCIREDMTKDDFKADSIILTQSDYFKNYKNLNNALLMAEHALQNDVCIFIGSSLTDIFQMNMIDDCCSPMKNTAVSTDRHAYAFMRLSDLQQKDKLGIYEYFKRKGILLLLYDKHEKLPDEVNELFKQ